MSMRDQHKRGFTLLELIIAVAILALVMGVTTPFMIDYYFNYRIITAQYDLVSVLRKAQSLAMTNQYEAPSGVFIAAGKFILFRGASYASRIVAFDGEVLYSDAISIDGPTEIVFSQLSGRPNATGTIALTSGKFAQNIIVNSEGMVNW